MFPNLATALANCWIFVYRGEYIGTASDGLRVLLGTVGDEAIIEKYLTQCPTPHHW